MADFDAIMRCAARFIDVFGEGPKPVPEDELRAHLEETLFIKPQIVACLDKRIITKREAANLILAHLDTWFAHRSGRTTPDRAGEGFEAFVEEMERALAPA